MPCTPAWQQEHTGVDAGGCVRIAREFAANAEQTEGRSMIVMGAGTNHWFHSDQTYRSMLSLVLFCGCQGVNGGGWAHYVGQEKVRPITGWSTVAFASTGRARRASNRRRPSGTWPPTSGATRPSAPSEFASPAGNGSLGARHLADCHALAARLGWLPSYPSFEPQPARPLRRGA